jgi:replicative DNA helicase
MSFVPEYTTFYDATDQQGVEGDEDYQYGSDDEGGGPQVADFGSF